jgi:hypothetical protein
MLGSWQGKGGGHAEASHKTFLLRLRSRHQLVDLAAGRGAGVICYTRSSIYHLIKLRKMLWPEVWRPSAQRDEDPKRGVRFGSIATESGFSRVGWAAESVSRFRASGRPSAAVAMSMGCVKTANSKNPFKLIWSCSFYTKILFLRRWANQWFLFARPAADQEGRFAVVTNVGCGMRWTRAARVTKAPIADGEVVASQYPDAGIKSAIMLAHCASDGDNQARSPGRPRRKPLKPFARGMPERDR